MEILKQERLGSRVSVIVSALRNIFWSVGLAQGLLGESLVEFLEAIGVSVVIFRVHKINDSKGTCPAGKPGRKRDTEM